MSPESSIPLRLEQVAAASLLMEQLEDLRRSDRALFALSGCFPGFDAESTLLKVVALHSLDASQAFAVWRLVAHLQRLLAGQELTAFGPEIVDAIAALPGSEDPKNRRRLTGFAARFAHYFIDLDRFPIVDAWSESVLATLGLPSAPASASRYVTYSRGYALLAQLLNLNRERDLWPCLWLTGQFRAWLKNPRTPIHRSVRRLFESGPRELLLLSPPEAFASIPAPLPSRSPDGAHGNGHVSGASGLPLGSQR